MTAPRTILIKNPLLVATMDDRQTEFHGGHLLLENGVIRSLGPEDCALEADEVIDARGHVVLPGFINTHHHFYQTLTRNIPRMQDSPLFDWLVGHYEIWRELTEDAVFVSAKTALLELMKSGVSTSSDHLYLFPRKAGGRLIDAEISAARELEVRFQPTRGSMSLGKSSGGLPPDDVVQTEQEIREDTERLLREYHDSSDGAMVRISLAPCSPFSVTPELMKQTAVFARENNLRIHTHLAETLDEERFCLDHFGQRPVDYVESLGWLNANSWFAHVVHPSEEEIDRLGQNGVGVSHCPSSNMRLGSGIAPVRKMLDAGVSVSLAVDGSASNDSGNMLLEIRNAMLLSRLRGEKEWLTARDVLRMATRGGAEVLGRSDIGVLAPGKQADLALFSLKGIEYAGALSDPLAALVFNVRTSPVDFLVVKGRVLIRNGKTGVNEETLAVEHEKHSRKMLEQAVRRTGIDFYQHDI